MKRLTIFILTNIAAVATLTLVAHIVCALMGVDMRKIAGDGGLVPLAVFALLLGFGGAMISLMLSKTVVKLSMKCTTIDGSEGPAERWLVSTVKDLAKRAGIKTPEVAIYPGEANAFATGARKDAALVAVSTGIIEQMEAGELKAVLAHEISHVANGDMVTMCLTQGVVNTFVIFFSYILASVASGLLDGKQSNRSRRGGGNIFMYRMFAQLFQFVLGLFAMIVLMWYSRKREYAADAGSAKLLGNPLPMIAALKRLGNLKPGILPESIKAFGIAGGMSSLFASHPSIEERIAALQNMPPDDYMSIS